MRFCSVGFPTVPRACGFVCKIAIVVGPLLSCPKHFGSDKIPKCPFLSSIEKPLNAQQLIAEYHLKNYEASHITKWVNSIAQHGWKACCRKSPLHYDKISHAHFSSVRSIARSSPKGYAGPLNVANTHPMGHSGQNHGESKQGPALDRLSMLSVL